MKKKVERASDIILFIFVTFPALMTIAFMPFCEQLNEGVRATCVAPFIEVAYGIFSGLYTGIAYSGALLLFPLVMIALIVSLQSRIRSYRAGYRPHGPKEISFAIVQAIPYAIAASNLLNVLVIFLRMAYSVISIVFS